MSDPIRYTGKTGGFVIGIPLWEHPKGEWVKWEDYARLKADLRNCYTAIQVKEEENNRLKAEVKWMTAFTTCTIIPNQELQAQVERLTKAGDNLERILTGYMSSYEVGNASHEWRAAKEGKQS